jgi:hypothetical protein
VTLDEGKLRMRGVMPWIDDPCFTLGAQAGVAGETHALSVRPSLACAHT